MGNWWSERTRTHEEDDDHYENRARSGVRHDSSKETTLREGFDTVVRHGDTTVEFKADGDLILRTEGRGNVDVFAETPDRIRIHAPTGADGELQRPLKPGERGMAR